MRDVEVMETINVRGAHGQIFKIRVRPGASGPERLAAMKVPAAPDREFLREMEIAELLRRYRHPYVVRYLGTGIAAEEPFILMELHEEGDLEDVIRLSGPLPLREALDILIQVAEAIHFLHGLGIYHRDIKAENIIAGRGQPKVADFGTARLYPRAGGVRLPEEEASVSPQQADRRRDAEMLGEVLYHALSGRKLYDARLFALAQRRRLAPAASTRPDSHLYRDVAARMDAVLRRANDAGRALPYPGVRYFLADLRRLRQQLDAPGGPARPARASSRAPGTVGAFLERAGEKAWAATQRELENAAPWIHLGNVHLVALRPRAADRAYTQALKRDPGNVIARLNQAYAAALQGQWERALHLAISAAARAPAALRATVRVRHVREARHLVCDAAELYARKDPSQPLHRLQRGYALDAQGLFQQAEREYRGALALHAEYAPAIEALAFLSLRRNDPRRALHYATSAVRVGEERAEAWLALGTAHLALDRPEEAAVALSRAVSLDPNHPHCRRDLARAWMALGEPEHAEEDCRHAVTVDPCWAEARLARGDTLAALGREDEARAAYRDAVAHNPECLDADGRPGLSFALG
ncbi:MAG: tetratricopeptide repeat protein [Armatimonadetes bacterium]|nr:tetratricopeptide repeat protein [Armatimonadota bacterium]